MTESSLSYFFMAWTDISLLLLTACGTFAGIYIGAIPGLSVTMAASILISFTFSWDINAALALMVGVFMGGVYGGSRSAILLNIPGAPASISTSFDGFPLAQRGEAGQAIGISTIISGIGGFIGIAVLAIAAPSVADFALKFAPRDYLLLAFIGLLLVGTLSGDCMAKGIFTGALGVTLGMVGMDPITCDGRFTFGTVSLLGGIHFVIAMIGLFGVAEALYQLHQINLKPVRQDVSKIIPSWKVIYKYLPLSIRTSLIGVIIGALPGTGGDIASLMAYDHAKRTVKNPSRPFGEGAYEGLIAPESANNAAVGGAYIPMLTLGIPGDAVTAVFIGALFIHGLKPGPMMMVDSPHMFWFMVGNLVLANIFMVIFGLTGIRIFTKLVEIRKGILIPCILVLSVVGTYSINNNMIDVFWMMAFGIFGYLLKMYGYQVAPIILGIILGPLMDSSYRQAVMACENNFFLFLKDLVTNPLTCVLTLIVVFMVISNTRLWPRFVRVIKGGGSQK